MAIFDVIVNTDDLVVLGPPENIDVEVSIGKEGPRGSTFYAGPGDPNDAAISQNIFGNTVFPVSGDIFINTQVGSKYGWLYIYNPKVVGNQWDQVLSISPNLYSSNNEIEFVSGTASISIPLNNFIISENEVVTADSFSINITPINSNPTVLTVSSKTIVSDDIVVSLSGLKYDTSWSQLNETIDASIVITKI